MMMKMRKMISMAMIAGSFFLAACSEGGHSGQADGGDSIQLGSMFELTGSAAAYGTSMNNAVKMAVEEINEAGGIDGKDIEIVEYDIQSDESQSAQTTTTLTTQDQVSAIVGPALTGTFQAAIPIAEQHTTPIISPTATDDAVLSQDDGSVYEYAYRACFTNSFQGTALAQFANDHLGAKKAVIFADNSSDYAQGLTDTFKENFDGEIVAVENFTADQTDFSASLTNIAELDFDVLYVPGYYEQGGPIIKQAREMGIDQPILGPDGFGNEIINDLAGMENMTNVFYTSHFAVESDDPQIQEFVQAYNEAFDMEPDMFTGLAYDSVYIVKEAIERAGSTDPTAINEELAKTENFEGVTGTFSFDEGHNPVKSVSIIEIQNGEAKDIHEVNPGE